jgi:uncharacterized membrane protein
VTGSPSLIRNYIFWLQPQNMRIVTNNSSSMQLFYNTSTAVARGAALTAPVQQGHSMLTLEATLAGTLLSIFSPSLIRNYIFWLQPQNMRIVTNNSSSMQLFYNTSTAVARGAALTAPVQQGHSMLTLEATLAGTLLSIFRS